MLLYIMLYIVLAYLMLFAALTNAVCLYNASFLPLISANAFYFPSCTVLLICLFFLILCSYRCCCFVLFFKIFFYERAMSSPEK